VSNTAIRSNDRISCRQNGSLGQSVVRDLQRMVETCAQKSQRSPHRYWRCLRLPGLVREFAASDWESIWQEPQVALQTEILPELVKSGKLCSWTRLQLDFHEFVLSSIRPAIPPPPASLHRLDRPVRRTLVDDLLQIRRRVWVLRDHLHHASVVARTFGNRLIHDLLSGLQRRMHTLRRGSRLSSCRDR
jgi:hypothetical protein